MKRNGKPLVLYLQSVREGEVSLSSPAFDAVLMVLVAVALALTIVCDPRREFRGTSAPDQLEIIN